MARPATRFTSKSIRNPTQPGLAVSSASSTAPVSSPASTSGSRASALRNRLLTAILGSQAPLNRCSLPPISNPFGRCLAGPDDESDQPGHGGGRVDRPILLTGGCGHEQ